jgi:hypothetical protein
MIWRVRAVFEDGSFVPLEKPGDIPEGAEVELRIEGPVTLPATVTDPAERKAIADALAARMRQGPWSGNVRRLTRDELHERR